MKLHSANPYSLLKHGLLHTYPSLSQNIDTEVAIIGAGITGALTAWYLTQAGVKCTVVDKRHVATGSTAASTSLIQYEIDTPLHKLIKKIGYERAVKSYQLCLKAIGELEHLTHSRGLECCFERKKSLQFASYKKDIASLKEECKLRVSLGFKVSFLEEKALKKEFSLAKTGGILSEEAAQLDAYLFTHKLLEQVVQNGNSIFDHTTVTAINHIKTGVELLTTDGQVIKARKLVIACGYESQQFIDQKVEELYTTYTILSEPLNDDKLWYENALIWETAFPYLYIRTTTDKRIVVGGKDTPYNPKTGFTLLNRKAHDLKQAFKKLFPNIQFKTDFKWAGVFGASKDGLPYIGTIPQRPNTYFALGYGGNGITFSLIAAQVIRDSITGVPNESSNLFSFKR